MHYSQSKSQINDDKIQDFELGDRRKLSIIITALKTTIYKASIKESIYILLLIYVKTGIMLFASKRHITKHSKFKCINEHNLSVL